MSLRSYAELLRLPNVFTAFADVLMGYLFTHETLAPGELGATLLAASGLLYLSGMVLNDVFDREIDAGERPLRPIPSGAISLGRARMIGFGFLLAGILLAWIASAQTGMPRPGLIGTLLAALIVGYNALVKHTPAGPVAMGGCRMLNVLLGMSAAPAPWQPVHWIVALGIATYVAGITWFARTEARRSSRPQLSMATAVMLAGIGLLAWFPNRATGAEEPPITMPDGWYLFWAIIALLAVWRSSQAIVRPTPAMVQAAVKSGIMSLIVLDAACLLAVQGPFWAIVVISLLVPMMILGRWIYST